MDAHVCKDLFDQRGALRARARCGRVERDNARVMVHDLLY